MATDTKSSHTADFSPLEHVAGGWVELYPRDGGAPVRAYVSGGRWLYRADTCAGLTGAASDDDVSGLADLAPDYTLGGTIGECRHVAEVFAGWRMVGGEGV